MTPPTRFIIWVVAVTALTAGQLLWLFLLRGPRIFESDVILIGGQFVLVVPILVIALLLKTTPDDAIKIPRRTSEWVIVSGTVLLQLAAVVLLRPALSEDLLRYRVDGRMWLRGESPYATAPLDYAQSDALDSLVPFPDMRTIYPAVSEATFALAAAVERAATTPVERVSPAPAGDESPWRRYLENDPSP